jgi:uncharacterized protein (TIGR03435 family)
MLNTPGRLAIVSLMAALPVMGAAAQQAPQFEVASVKASPPFDPQQVLSGKQRIGTRMDAGRVEMDGLPLGDIINAAFRVKSYQVTAPSWLGTGLNAPRFDIHATIPAGATTEQVPEMLQALLAERFKLAYHRENKEASVYALIVGKNGLKLQESPPDPPKADAAPDAAPPTAPGPSGLIARGGQPQVQVKSDGRGAFTIAGGGSGPMRMSMTPDGAMHLEVDRVSLAQLAETLTRLVDRPVIDQTGLKGNYKIALDLAREDLMTAARAVGVPLGAGALGAPGGGASAPTAPDPSGGSIFNSVERMGLKLDARKIPIEHIVIDRLERTPTDD